MSNTWKPHHYLLVAVGALAVIVFVVLIVTSIVESNASQAREQQMLCDMLFGYGSVDYWECVD